MLLVVATNVRILGHSLLVIRTHLLLVDILTSVVDHAISFANDDGRFLYELR